MTAVWVKGIESPNPCRRRAQQPESAESGQKPEPRYGRREHERQLDQRHDKRMAPKAAACEQIGERRAEEDDQHLRHQGRLEAHDQRVANDRIRELAEQPAGRHAKEDRQHRQGEERQRDCRCREEQNRDEPPPSPTPDTHGTIRSASALPVAGSRTSARSSVRVCRALS